jgi:regulatory protein
VENWKPKRKTPSEALELLKRQCSLREYCQSDIRTKLFKWSIHSNDQEAIIAELIGDGFLNEERFAQAYVHDKAVIQGWGPVKIKSELLQKGVSNFSIDKGLNREDIAFDEIFEGQFEKYKERYKSLPPKKRNTKIAQRLLQRGFDSASIWKLIREEK